jgi:hypothetical protein
VETHQLELWFLVFFRSAIAISERRIALGVHATVSTVLRPFGRGYGNAEAKQSGGNGASRDFCWTKHSSRETKGAPQ